MSESIPAIPSDVEILNIIEEVCKIDTCKSKSTVCLFKDIIMNYVKSFLKYVAVKINSLKITINTKHPERIIKKLWDEEKYYLPFVSYATGSGFFEHIIIKNINKMFPEYGIICFFVDPELDLIQELRNQDESYIFFQINNREHITFGKAGMMELNDSFNIRENSNEAFKTIYTAFLFILQNTKLFITIQPSFNFSISDGVDFDYISRENKKSEINIVDKIQSTWGEIKTNHVKSIINYLNNLGFVLRTLPNEAKVFIFWIDITLQNNTLRDDNSQDNYIINTIGNLKAFLQNRFGELTIIRRIKITSNIAGNIIISERP